ncbi:hypothetical protein [Synechococcus sp. BA-132 BA5]|uniref:hypothetical protein n=1 Tax=Synechococcus sp. BA-132 BA5 TaxID=3110252 RepID=UPI002B1FFDC8|nr:hypothetical protein [Synechococcus sp. BA-132 BA5]MEA5417294.1 hypothetical protein [Synechococcus sp. BA-132 BA5]
MVLSQGSLSGSTWSGTYLIALATLAWAIDNNLSQRLSLLGIGAFGYGISIWLDLLALRNLGAAREAVIFSTAPFVGTLLALLGAEQRLQEGELPAPAEPDLCSQDTDHRRYQVADHPNRTAAATPVGRAEHRQAELTPPAALPPT